jgi:uncharacterized protein YcaQ
VAPTEYTLWFAGRIAIVGRQGRERVWDLADRARQPLGPAVAAALRRLASWLGAELDVSGDVPGPWAAALR